MARYVEDLVDVCKVRRDLSASISLAANRIPMFAKTG
jgi:hypothetical protein